MSFYQTENAQFAEKVTQYLSGKKVDELDLLALFASQNQAELEAYMSLSPEGKRQKQQLSAEQYFQALDNLSEFIQAGNGNMSPKNLQAMEILHFNSMIYAKQAIPKSQRRRHPFRIMAINRAIKAFNTKYNVERNAIETYRSRQNDLNERYQASIKEETETRAQSEAFRAEENAAYLSTLSESERAKEEALQNAERAENEILNKMFLSTKQLLARQNTLADLKQQVGYLQPADEKQLQTLQAQVKEAQTALQEKVAQLTVRAQLMCKLGQMTPDRYAARVAQLQSGDFSYSLYNSEAARRAAGQLSGHELNEITLSRLEGKARDAFQTEINSLAKDQHERTGSFFALPKEMLKELQSDIERLTPDTAELALAQVEQHGVNMNKHGISRIIPLSNEAHAKYRAKANEAYLSTLSPEARREEEALQKRERKENKEIESMYNSIIKLRQDAFHASSSRRFNFYQKKRKAVQAKLDRRMAELFARTKLEHELGRITPERYQARMNQLQYGDFSYSLYNTTEARIAAGQYSMYETVNRITPPFSDDEQRLKNDLSVVERFSVCSSVLRGEHYLEPAIAELSKLSPEIQQLALTAIEKNGVDLEAKGGLPLLKLSRKQVEAYTERYNKMLAENYGGLYSKATMTLTTEQAMEQISKGQVPLSLCSDEVVKQQFDAGFTALQNRIKGAVESALKHPTKDEPLFMTDAQRADFFAKEIDVMMQRFFKNPDAPENAIDMKTLLTIEDDYEFRQALFAKTPIMNYIGIRYQEKDVTSTEKKEFTKQHEAKIKEVIAKVDLSKYVNPLKAERVQSSMYNAFLRSYNISAQTKQFEDLMNAHAAAEKVREEAQAAKDAGGTLTEAQSKALTEPTPLEAYVEKQAKLYFANGVAEQRQMIQKRTQEYALSKFSKKPITKEQLAKSLLTLKKDTMGYMEYQSKDLPKFMENEESIHAYIDQYDIMIQENREAFRNQVEYESKREALDAAANEARGSSASVEETARLRAVYEQKKAEFNTYQAAYQADPKNKLNTTTEAYRSVKAMEGVPALQQQKKQLDLSSRLQKTTAPTQQKSAAPQATVQAPSRNEQPVQGDAEIGGL